MWEATNKGGTGFAVEKKRTRMICAKIRNCSQEGGEKNEMGIKRNMGGDGN